MIRIEAKHFVAGIDIRRHPTMAKGFMNRCAPIIWYMKFWSPVQIKHYCARKGWHFEIIDLQSHEIIIKQRKKIIESGNAKIIPLNRLKLQNDR